MVNQNSINNIKRDCSIRNTIPRMSKRDGDLESKLITKIPL